MRTLTCILITAAGLAAQTAAKTTTAPAKPAAKTATAATKTAKKSTAGPMEVPKDAVQTSPGFYKWTDKEGKVWMYRRTPFGVSRRPFGPTYDKHEVLDNLTTAKDQGDSIRFERTGPFGKRSWMRKKSQLTENEKAIWANQQKNAAATTTKAEKE